MTLKIVLTGGTSFTGYWFAKELVARGHEVLAPITGDVRGYEGARAIRAGLLTEFAHVVDNAPVGSHNFARALDHMDGIDVVCLHHAVVGDYHSADFDVGGAVTSATAGAFGILDACQRKGAAGVVLTHSIFEAGRGVSEDARPIGMYAIAKAATGAVWSERARQLGLPVSRFTIANPFGPLEEPRLVNYLVRSWQAGNAPVLKAPDWVRDNVPVPLLAAAYAAVVEGAATGDAQDITPSHTVVSNLEYARTIGARFSARWRLPCPVGYADEHARGEPRLRAGMDRVCWSGVPQSEAAFWDQYADYYSSGANQAKEEV